MKKISILFILSILLCGCSYLRIHKADVDQGNIFTQEEVSRLHLGMSQTAVKDIMGDPLLINIFSPQRLVYIYTFKPGYGSMQEKKVILLFQNGRLQHIQYE